MLVRSGAAPRMECMVRLRARRVRMRPMTDGRAGLLQHVGRRHESKRGVGILAQNGEAVLGAFANGDGVHRVLSHEVGVVDLDVHRAEEPGARRGLGDRNGQRRDDAAADLKRRGGRIQVQPEHARALVMRVGRASVSVSGTSPEQAAEGNQNHEKREDSPQGRRRRW